MAIPSNDQWSNNHSFSAIEREFLSDLWQAYTAAKKWKTSLSIDTCNLSREKEIMHLFHKLYAWQRKPSTYTAFIIEDPVCREIFAAPFTDRIVYHLTHHYLAQILEPRMCYDSYGARIGKGIHFWIQRVYHFIRSCKQQHYIAYIMKLDIENFFHSINHQVLLEKILPLIVQHPTICPLWHERLSAIARHIITHDPTQDAIIIDNKEDWQKLPKHKSLFSAKIGTWIPLGNITSQLFANRYLTSLDHFIKHDLQAKRYGRYMDDMIFVHHDRQVLLVRKKQIQQFLLEKLHLILHPSKLHLQESSKWVTFVWYRLHDRGISLWPRIINKRHAKIRSRNYRIREKKEHINPIHVRDTMNTYLGWAQHGKNRSLRKKMYNKLHPILQNELIPKAGCHSLRLRKRTLTKKQLRNIKYDSPELFL